MKLLLFLFFSFNCLYSQSSFEGLIKYKTSIEYTDAFDNKIKKGVLNKYGDSLTIFYSKEGFFKRVFHNTGYRGNDFVIYNPQLGTLNHKYNGVKSINVDTTINNSLSLEKITKVENEKIMDLDCHCYEYEAKSIRTSDLVVLKYCFSSLTPFLNCNLFSKHKDFFMSDFFKLANRPYLKLEMKFKFNTITFTAYNIIESKLDANTFKVE